MSFKNGDLNGTVGAYIDHLNNIDDVFHINRLSDLGPDWSIPSKCPSCGKYLEFNAHNVNKIFSCKCGQKIAFQISSELL